MSRVKCLAWLIRIEFAPASPCSYRWVVNRKWLRTHSRANKRAEGTTHTHHGRRPADPVDPVEPVPPVRPSGRGPTAVSLDMRSDGSGLDGRVDPGNDLVQHGI